MYESKPRKTIVVLRAYSGALGVALLVGSLVFVWGRFRVGKFGVTNWFICMRFKVNIHSRLDGYTGAMWN